jgi:hypothetical protein
VSELGTRALATVNNAIKKETLFTGTAFPQSSMLHNGGRYLMRMMRKRRYLLYNFLSTV